MLPENQEVSEKANSLDLSKVKIELLASASIPDTFKQQSETLLQEYCSFLALKVIIGDTKPPLMYSPSAIIDQVWHIHLLMPAYYASCCKELGVDMIDHDPSTARDALEVRSKRVEMTKKMYHLVFQKMPPQLFWTVTYNQIRRESVYNQRLTVISDDELCPVVPDKQLPVKPISDPGPSSLSNSEAPSKKIKTESISEKEQVPENLSKVSPGNSKAEMVTFCVMLNGGHTIRYTARRSLKFQKIFDRFSEDTNQPLHRIRFNFDGTRIYPHDTADSLKLVDNDVIDVFHDGAGC